MEFTLEELEQLQGIQKRMQEPGSTPKNYKEKFTKEERKLRARFISELREARNETGWKVKSFGFLNTLITNAKALETK